MKKKCISIFDSISFFSIYFIATYVGFIPFNLVLTLTLIFVFIAGVFLSYMKGSENQENAIDVMNRLFLSIYVIGVSLFIYFLFYFLSLSIFTNIVLGAIYAIFLILIFIMSIKDFFIIISGY